MPRKKKEEEKQKYIFAVGRRKEAVARVRLFEGEGKTLVNDLPIEEYFSGEVAKIFYSKPFALTNTLGKYYATIKVEGGGKSGQLQAVVHGLSRALALVDPQNFRPILKKQKLLTCDSRVRERRKVGTGGKARRKKQSPKR
jgi:small subunit ribosomal protein S9